MTRSIVYASALVALIGAAGMSTAAVLLPSWATYVIYPTDPDADPFWLTLGLHQSCASDGLIYGDGSSSSSSSSWVGSIPGYLHRRPGHCRPFPRRSIDCAAGSVLSGLAGLGRNSIRSSSSSNSSGASFCTAWRTAGFLMEASLVVELALLVGFLAVLAGGSNRRIKRHFGWRVLSPLLVLAAALQMAAMAVVAHVVQTDDRFLVPGWSLATSWRLCTASWVVALLSGAGLALSAWALPPEDGYDFLDDLLDPDDAVPSHRENL